MCEVLKEDEEPVIRTAVTYMIEGQVSDEEFSKIKSYCINPVDSRETGMEKPDTLITVYDDPADVAIFDGFRDMDESSLKALYESLGLAMTFKDFKHIQNYFHDDEKRDPSMTEIRVLDTYWSDHCRHTTFSTELTDVEFGEGYYRSPLETTYQSYLDTREEIFKGREDKFVCLMDLALMAMRKLKKDGKLDDMEESDEINACSVVVPVEMDYGDHRETEEWLVFSRTRPTIILQRSSLSVALPPVWAVLSVILCPVVAMYIRRCVSPVQQILPFPYPRHFTASCPRRNW